MARPRDISQSRDDPAGGEMMALFRLLRFGPTALAALARFAMRARRPHRRAFAEALRALGDSSPGEHGDPLTELFPHVYEIERAYLDALGLPGLQPRPLTFIHLSGTGEPLHAMLPGLEVMLSLQPQLASHRHLVLDVPDEPGTFDGAEQFLAAAQALLDPVLARSSGPIVLVGLSRGGTAALELAAGWVESRGLAVGVLAMSPPIIGDYQRPQTVRDIASLEPTMIELAKLVKPLPAWLRNMQNWGLRRSYLSLTCFTLVEFGMAAPAVLRWSAWDLKHCEPIPAILRANREFNMLLRVTDEVLHDGCKNVARVLAAHGRLEVCILWGQQDAWVPAERCAARAQACFEQAGVPSDRIHIEILPGWGHAMSRQLSADFTQLADRLAQLATRVAAASPSEAEAAP